MGSVWTLARLTIAESVRMKIALFFIVLLTVLVLGMPFASKGDNSVSGAVQSFLAYSISVTSVLLSCLTIFLSKSFSDDLAGKQILTLMTKPLARWQYVVGKWLGILLLDFALLAVSGLAIYTMTRFLASKPPRDDFDRERLENQVLIARHATDFIIPDFTDLAKAAFEENLEQGKYAEILDFNEEAEEDRLRAELEQRWRALQPRETREFEFEDVRCDRSPETIIHIGYQNRVYNFPPDEILRCQWYVGNRGDGCSEYLIPRRDVIDRRHTLPVPADTVAADNSLTAWFINANPFEGETQHPNTVVFEGPDAVQVLFAVSSFGSNLIRALTLVFCRLAFLAALAIAATTVFSFPVASLVALTVYVLAATQGFLSESIDWLPEKGAGGAIQVVLNNALRAAYFVIPNFARFDGLSVLVDGRNVTLKWVLLGVGQLVMIQTTLLLLIACLLFQRREVAEVSV